MNGVFTFYVRVDVTRKKKLPIFSGSITEREIEVEHQCFFFSLFYNENAIITSHSVAWPSAHTHTHSFWGKLFSKGLDTQKIRITAQFFFTLKLFAQFRNAKI